jgi:hypothetical protein
VSGERPAGGEPTRERVRAVIGEVGGYWRPLAALARLLEELGELAELSALVRPDGPSPQVVDSRASELADLWIITTALADQFLADVAEPDSYAARPAPSGAPAADTRRPWEGLGELLVAAGTVARIVNYYDGPKTPRTFEGWVSLSDAVARFHRALADVAYAQEVDLALSVGATLDAIPAADAGRFGDGEHDDPSTAASLKRFRVVQDASSASHATARARLWGSPEWSPTSIASNVDALLAGLVSFTRAAAWERLDGYLVAGPSFASTELLEEWLARLLLEIAARDSTSEETRPTRMSAAGRELACVSGAGRQLAFNGLCLSVAVFSPLYQSSDPRHSPSGTFALLSTQTPGRDASAQ